MKAVVTGGAGMVGSALVQKLLELGHEVTVIDNLSRGRVEFIPKGARFVAHDLAYGLPKEALIGTDQIFHLACRVGGVNYMLVDQDESYKNAALDWQVLSAAFAFNIPLFYMSTSCVYPVRRQTEEALEKYSSVMSEDLALEDGAEPESIYGWCKLVGELVVAQYVKEYPSYRGTIARGFNYYGPGEYPDQHTGHVIPALITKVLNHTGEVEVWGTGKQLRTFTYVDDAVRGMLAIVRDGRPGVPYNLGSEGFTTIAELAEMIVELCHELGLIKTKPVLRYNPEKPQGVFGRSANPKRLQEDTGWIPKTTLEEGLRETIEWCWVHLGRDLRENREIVRA